MRNGDTTLEAKYSQLEEGRRSFLSRAQRCSELTQPTLIPPDGHGPTTEYYTPWQSIGARGVNNLASKLLLSLLPPNSPFFRLIVDDFTLDELAGRPGGRAMVDEGLNKIERAVQSEVEASGLRSPVFLTLKNLIVGGNYLIYLPPDANIRGYRMDRFVVQRDVMGNVLEVIAKDEVSREMLSEEDRALLSDDESDDDDGDISRDKNIKVFTRWFRDGTRWKMYQEIAKKRVPGSEGSWPIEKPPFMALRWTAVDGEDYGRSYVEEYIGDLIALEGLSKAVVESAAVAAKVVFLLNPNGVTRMRDITKAESGDIIIGKVDDVAAIQTQKQADMRIAYEAAKTITERLSFAFLMHSSVQRQAERVTAEEIRFMASELEDALGGVYSILSQEFQMPLVNRIMDRMIKAKRLPALPKGVVKPAIVTGLEALGRGHDLNKYLSLLKALQPLGPEVLAKHMNPGDYISRVATSLGIDASGLVKSEDQMAQEQQQAQQMAQMQQMQQMMGDVAGKAAPGVVKGIADEQARASEADAAPPQEQ
jgi:hypothetical protein